VHQLVNKKRDNIKMHDTIVKRIHNFQDSNIRTSNWN